MRYDNPPSVPYPGHATYPPRNGFGLTSVILGPIGLLFGLMPITGFIGLTLGIIGSGLGIAGIKRVSRGEATNRGAAITGTVLSVLAIILGIVAVSLFFKALADLGDSLDRIGNR